jgi:predicted Zn-dependent protease
MTTRADMLREFLTQNPSDAFARYGLAMEHKNAGDTEAALDEFDTLLRANPDYTAAYFMAAQTLAAANRTDAAKQRLREGIASAERTGNQHAKSEMSAMLEELGG